jgi:glycosyltransferase involved in cell wall biosynthesis
MQLTALVDSPDHVCCRYRLAAFRSFFESAGHSLELQSWPADWWSRLRIGRAVRHTDAVILQRRLLPSWQLHLLRRSARRLIFDFDDAVFLRDSYAGRGIRSSSRLRRFAAVMNAADVVVAGNEFLRGQANRWCSSDRIVVIPTCVDPARYPLAEHVRSGAGVQLVWVGSASTLRGLEMIQPLLEQIGQQWPGLRLKLVCNRFLQLRHLPVLPCCWSEKTEAAQIAAADIGLSWVPDDDWSRGKCGLKVLQYMAAGLPVVANPVGVQADLVRHGETGFVAETPVQWLKAIGVLMHDPALRRRMGQAGRQRVEADFSLTRGAERWLALVNSWAVRQDVA